jgi:hypothetical protein
MKRLRGAWLLFVCLVAVAPDETIAQAVITFHNEAPTPDFDDVFSFIGASRDGLNVNDQNGLDGPLDDSFTYVANDRPRQGQYFRALPATQVYRLQSIWIRIAGYTDNGSMPETGFNGTDTDFSAGGAFTVRVLDAQTGGSGVMAAQSYILTGTELNNPNPTGRSSTTNGPGTWMKIDPSGSVRFGPDHLYGFDISSTGEDNRLFEWLGTSSDAYAAGSAYNGTQLGFGSSNFETTRNPLTGDRVFMVQMTLIPEPSGLGLAALGSLALMARRRFHR